MESTTKAEARSGHSPGRCRLLDGILAVLLFLVLGTVFLLSPVRYLGDARYTMLLAEELLLYGSFDLAPYFSPHDASFLYANAEIRNGLPRNVRRRGQRVFHVYPYGSSVLSVPFLAGLRALGYSTIDAEGRYSHDGEMEVQGVLASILAALTGVVFYALGRRLLSPGWSVALALAAALGSQLWSTASRSMWSHTWGLLLLALALLVLLYDEHGPRRLPRWRPPLLATLLSWAFFVRPTAVAYIVPIAVYVLWRDRRKSTAGGIGRESAAFLATGFLWLVAFLVHSRLVFGQDVPDYYRRGSGLGLDTLALGLEANLLSPGRGLLVYCPWVMIVLYLVVRHFRGSSHRGLAVTAVAVAVLHLLVVSANVNWWAGASYGPRFMTETVPLWTLLAAIGWRAALDHFAARPKAAPLRVRHALLQAVAVLLVLTSWTFHGAGAITNGWAGWNSVPDGIPWQPMRVFDWKEAQFLWALDPERTARQRRAAERDRWPRPKLAQKLGRDAPSPGVRSPGFAPCCEAFHIPAVTPAIESEAPRYPEWAGSENVHDGE
jgi:hypothetical protein